MYLDHLIFQEHILHHLRTGENSYSFTDKINFLCFILPSFGAKSEFYM